MIPTARNVLTRPPTGTPRRAICPGEGLPTPYTSLKGSGRGCPLLRASSDYCFIVGALRARRAPGRSLLILLRPRVARARGSVPATPRPLFQHPAIECPPGRKTGRFYVSTSFCGRMISPRHASGPNREAIEGKWRRGEPIRLRKNYCVTAGCSNSPSSKAAGESKPEAYPLGYVEDFDESRTPLADCFSILLLLNARLAL